MNVEFNINNADFVVNSIKRKIVDNADDALRKACALLVREAVMKCPKDTGALARSISFDINIDGDKKIGTVFAGEEYAPYVEYGTGLFAEEHGRQETPWHYKDEKGEWHSTNGQKPQPFMRPALYENEEKIKNIIAEELIK